MTLLLISSKNFEVVNSVVFKFNLTETIFYQLTKSSNFFLELWIVDTMIHRIRQSIIQLISYSADKILVLMHGVHINS